MDIDSFWEYSDPAISETRFRAALSSATQDERLELLTQIARTHSLRGQFAEAHALLDEVEPQLAPAGPRPKIRYGLERGRTFNSSGHKEMARAEFHRAWQQALAANESGLAVDAAHMLALAYAGAPEGQSESQSWFQRGLSLARASTDSKAQGLIPALLNNAAWNLHDTGQWAEALPLFEQALVAWTARQRPVQIQIARWSVARCLRSLGRYTEALDSQRALEAEHRAAGTTDGYVYEEIAENLMALKRAAEAQPYFRQAVEALSQDEWFVKNEADRLARLRALADLA